MINQVRTFKKNWWGLMANGLQFCQIHQTFPCQTFPLYSRQLNTKCKVLQVVASIFDPLGYFTPTVLELHCSYRDCGSTQVLLGQETS